MTIAATGSSAVTTTAPSSPPPPPPPTLSPVQEGDVAAGRLRAVDGRLFSVNPQGRPNDAPAIADWGAQATGSPYRQTWDAVGARLGTGDAASIAAEIERQLYGAAAPAPAPAPTPTVTEGVGSFVEGAVLGNFSDNGSWSATGGQVAVGFVPVLGQIADARDTIASIGQIVRGEDGGWFNLGASAIGWVPGVGDGIKAAMRGGGRVADAGAEIAQGAARGSGDLAAPVARASERLGIPAAEVRRIVDLPRGSRPEPASYIDAGRIDAHLAPFRESGAVRFTPAKSVADYGTLGPPGGTFVIPGSQFEQLMAETGGDLAAVETRLGLDAGSLTSGETIGAYIAPEDLRGLRMPSGNELGANDKWVPGGYTSGGMPEATIDVPADVPYARISFGE